MSISTELAAQKNALHAIVTVRWGDSVMATRHLREGASAVVGAQASAMVAVPCEALGVPAITFAAVRGGAAIAFVPAGAVGFRERAGAIPAAVAGPSEITLVRGEVVSFSVGAFLLTIAAEEPPSRAPWVGVAPSFASSSPLRYVAVAALAHAAFIGLSAQAAEARTFEDTGNDNEDMARYLAAADARSEISDKQEAGQGDGQTGADVNGHEGNGKAGGGERAAGREGSMGTSASRSNSSSHYAVSGKDGGAKTVAATRDEVLEQARSFGLNTILAEATHAPIPTFGEGLASADPFAANGAMWGHSVGETYGAGGLGLSGIGEGGGGGAIGSIGLGSIGTLGHTFGESGLGTGGSGVMAMGFGWGGSWSSNYSCIGIGRIGRIGTVVRIGHLDPGVYDLNASPRERKAQDQGDGEARLPAETIRRIVHLASGRFRACYEPALASTPDLKGGVTTKFLIGGGGGVKSAHVLATDMPQDVAKCVTRVFSTLSFPDPPDGRPVTVTYPLTFTPTKSTKPALVVER